MKETLLALPREKVSVGTTVLQVHGDSSWATAKPQPQHVRYTVSNLGTTDLFVRILLNHSGSLTGTVSSTDFDVKIVSEDQRGFELAPNQSLAVVRAGGTGDVAVVGQVIQA
jgi:hypothetical protein